VSTVVNITGWLTTIVSRVCLDMLRTRRRRREDITDMTGSEPAVIDDGATPCPLTARFPASATRMWGHAGVG
jgi:DNA-directed RNA polymerase specialized sigma24 family protein